MDEVALGYVLLSLLLVIPLTVAFHHVLHLINLSPTPCSFQLLTGVQTKPLHAHLTLFCVLVSHAAAENEWSYS